MGITRRSCLALLLPLGSSLPAADRQETWTILSLGDSITEGSDHFSSYRTPLARLLTEGNFKVRFVGSRHSPGEPQAMHHEGYSGKTAEFLAAHIRRIYRANPADIILLHAGHNHFADEHPVPGIVAATGKIIRTARSINPNVIVLLAQVIPSGKLPKYSYLPDLNRELARLAARLNTRRQPVILVDQAAGFDFHSDTVQDLVHPNAAGAAKMAARWYEALVPILSGPHPAHRSKGL